MEDNNNQNNNQQPVQNRPSGETPVRPTETGMPGQVYPGSQAPYTDTPNQAYSGSQAPYTGAQAYQTPPGQAYQVPPTQGYRVPPGQNYQVPPGQNYQVPPEQMYQGPFQQAYPPGQAYDPYYEQVKGDSTGERVVKKAKSAGWTFYYVMDLFCNFGLTAFSGILFAMTHIWTFLLATLVFITLFVSDIRRISSKNYPKKFWRTAFASGALLGLLIYMMMTPVSFKSRDRDDYGRYINYTHMVGNTGSFFPLEYRLPKDIKEYKFSTKTKAYKKSNWTSLRFKMNPNSDEWYEFLEWMHLEEYEYDFSLIDDDAVKTLSYYDKKDDFAIKGHHFKYDEDFWDGNEKHAYVLYPRDSYTNYGLGVNESRVIIINWEKGMIEFSQLMKK